MAVDRERVSALVRELLVAIGEDPDRPGLRLTPQRVADTYSEFFSGVGEDAAAPLAHTISVSTGPAPDTLPSGAVMLRDIRFRPVCEHHLLPFSGHAHIGYIADERIIGISKLTRLVRLFARRFTVQERLGEQIADGLISLITPRGVAIHLEASHLCTQMRGVEERSRTVTTFWRGDYEDAELRREFLNEVRSHSGR